jgi:hypothetical protein
VRRYAGLYPPGNPISQQTELVRWVTAIALADSDALAEVRSRFVARPSLNLRGIVNWSETLGVGLEDADRAADIYEKQAMSVGRRAVMAGVVPYLLNRGRPSAASRLLATAERGFGRRADVGVLEFRIYAALYWDGDSSEAAAAVQPLETYLDGAPVRLGQVEIIRRLAVRSPIGGSLATSPRPRRPRAHAPV